MKNNPLTLFRKLAAIMAVPAISILSSPHAQAAAFTAGNVVVMEYGDGVATLGSAAAADFVVEYLPSAANQASPVQSIAIPSTGASRLTGAGTGTSEGFITRSTNLTSVVFGGYDADVGTAAIAGTTATAQNRIVGRVDVTGNFTRGSGGSTVSFSGSAMRGVASDGVNFWEAGTASTSGTGGGMWYSAAGGAPIRIGNGNASGNIRVARIFNGTLYLSTGSGTVGIWAYTGIPTAAATAVNIITVATSSPYDFAINPAGTVAYICDDGSVASGGGIQKWTFNGTSWSLAYTFGSAAGLTSGCRGLAVDFSGGTPVLYATTADSATKLITIIDTGSTATATTLATAASNRAFRGVALAPIVTTSGPPLITGISPAGTTNSSGNSITFTVSASGSTPLGYTWYKEIPLVGAAGSTNAVPGGTNATLAFPSAATTDSANYQVVVTNSFSPSATSSVVTLLITNAAPSSASISPLSITSAAGSAAAFTVTASGSLPLSYFWYKEIPLVGAAGSTNLIVGATNAVLSFTNTAVSDTASYQVIVSNAFSPPVIVSAAATLVVTAAPPVITGIGPTNVVGLNAITLNAGVNVSFTVTNTGTAPFGYLWYKEIPLVGALGSTNLLPYETTSTLTLSNVLLADAANYQVIITNLSSTAATSSVVSVTVTNDPHIASQPSSTYGLQSGVVHFTVGVIGTAPTYAWYYTDPNGIAGIRVVDGTLPSGSIISGSATSTLTFSNLQFVDATNFYVVASANSISVTSTVASIFIVTNSTVLAFWDFNGVEFTNTLNNPTSLINPVPFIGVGTAAAFGTVLTPPTSPFSGSVDNNDGQGFEQYPNYAYAPGQPAHAPAFSWGTSTYPTNGNLANNKTAGVQFTVSTVGAKNVKFSYEARTSATASKYYRMQFTTNGTDWVDYPSSSTFGSVSVTYLPFSFDLTGIPGVANNPNFAVRVASEFVSTATYGISSTNSYLGVANNYGTGGTLSYDVVTFTGDAITNNNTPPTVAGFTNVTMVDYIPYTNTFTVGDDTTPVGSIQVSAVSLNTPGFNPTFEFVGTGATRQMIIHPNSIAQTFAAAPILVTVTDANGDSTVTWFTATVGTINLPPTNSLTTLVSTNTLANKTLTIPFLVGDDRTPVTGLAYNFSSGNTTLVPSGNISIGNTGTTNPMLTIIPASNQLGEGTITVVVDDQDTQADKTTTATFPFMVRPNTNIIGIDYFTYDNSGSLDTVSGGYWRQLSGPFGQMQVSSSASGGVVNVNTFGNTENVQTTLLGAPYSTNSSAVLYASLVVNMNISSMPIVNGSYFTAFNDGSGSTGTANVEALVVASTNNAAPGYYRLGISNRTGAVGTNSQMFATDLLPNSNYVIVVSLVVSNGVSTLWVAPTSPASPSVTDTNALTTKFNISDFELRESGANAGQIGVSFLKVGTTFDSVFPSLKVTPVGTNVVVNWSDATIGIQSSTNLVGPYTDVLGAVPPYTNNASTNSTMFYRFGH